MAFDLGQRVTSTFTGTGTITGDLIKECEIDAGKMTFLFLQEVTFDNPALGIRAYEIKKLNRVEEDENGA
jgi:hypothetical protein